MNETKHRVGADAVARKGWWRAHRWLVLRRASQLGVLVLFLLGPWAGIWIVKGNIASSLTLEVLPLTDPYVLLQALAAGTLPASSALIGAGIVLAFYLLVGGRVYCAWVCPMNAVTDAAEWLRRRLGWNARGMALNRRQRYWLLGVTLVLAALTGTIAWEQVNPVSTLYRGLVFGMGAGWFLVAAIFLFDLLLARRGWCGHLCPVGAFYGTLGEAAAVRVVAARRERCDDCMDCYQVCPEPQVIRPALRPASPAATPLIRSGACTNCGRCIDVCGKEVFEFGTRFHGRAAGRFNGKMEAMP